MPRSMGIERRSTASESTARGYEEKHRQPKIRIQTCPRLHKKSPRNQQGSGDFFIAAKGGANPEGSSARTEWVRASEHGHRAKEHGV
ncbi:hypothetical protein CF651_21370 [Paenibacillus rigui]|uniref:Uncharacterized protein n=1 Tax=Paenibacillus rigui TaxID=554312 RepID=A0A229ULZ7_9BACL|nr:hypothetical protein CF651_21370 [Paenibacillus rigui]